MMRITLAMIAVLSLMTTPLLFAQGPRGTTPEPRNVGRPPIITGNPDKDLETATERLGQRINSDLTNFAKQLQELIDTEEAANLAVAIPEVQDTVGNACWKSFNSVSLVLKAHPLPMTFHAATDIEAFRLTIIALNQVCTNPNCGQMWTDAQNVVSALSITPLPLSFTSLCSKIPAIGTLSAVGVTPVQPAASASGGTPGPIPPTPAKP